MYLFIFYVFIQLQSYILPMRYIYICKKYNSESIGKKNPTPIPLPRGDPYNEFLSLRITGVNLFLAT